MVRTIRLDDERIAEILDGLDGNDAPTETGRQAPRYRYRIKALVVHMQQPGFSSPVPFLVPGRNISCEGLSFLHGGFVHPGTRCLVQLITSYGTWTNAGGTVVRCQLIEGNVHEVGVRLDREIDPAVYCADAVRSRVLLAEDDPSIARLARFHLEQLNADVDLAQDGAEAVDMAINGNYDLVLMDIEMPVMDGLTAVKMLRSRGYTGLIAAATALTQPEDAERCISAGCDKYLPKPFTRAELSALLVSLRAEPLFSTFHDDPSMRDLVREFVTELPQRVRKMDEAVAGGDASGVKTVARTLKAEGTSYGFDIITEVAEGIEKDVIAGKDLAEVRKDVDRLAKLCTRVRTPKSSQPAASRNRASKDAVSADAMTGQEGDAVPESAADGASVSADRI